MSNVCVKWLVATRYSPPPPLLPLLPPPPAPPAPHASSLPNLRWHCVQTQLMRSHTISDFESTLGNEKVKTTRASRKVNEKIVKKKCRLETAATVLFRVVLALSGKCFIMVCAFIPETKIML